MEPDDEFDVAIRFSDAKIEIVEEHFNLSIPPRLLPEESYDLIDIPDSLFAQLVLLHKRNSSWPENARRTVISLFLAHALDYVDVNNKLFVYENMGFSCVKEENGTRYKYSGPVDFAIGYSDVDSYLMKDCAFLFVQAKTVAKLGEALGQALAQAATNFSIRKQENKGVDGHLKVHWCISDGESWKFGYITEGKGGMLDVKQSTTTTCWFHQPHMVPEKEVYSKLFSLIVWWIQKALESSDTSSRQNSGSDLESLDANFLKASIIDMTQCV